MVMSCWITRVLWLTLPYLGGWHHTEGVHDAVWIFLTDLANEQGSHAGAGTSAQRVGELEALEAVTALRLFTDHIQD